MKPFLATVGFFTICGWIADLAFGAAIAIRGLPLPGPFGGVFMHFAYGLFGGVSP